MITAWVACAISSFQKEKQFLSVLWEVLALCALARPFFVKSTVGFKEVFILFCTG
jgi:hypothetical protein